MYVSIEPEDRIRFYQIMLTPLQIEFIKKRYSLTDSEIRDKLQEIVDNITIIRATEQELFGI